MTKTWYHSIMPELVNNRKQKTPGSGHGAHSELKRARTRAAFSVAVNLFLSIIKGYYGVIAGSQALLSDAIHSATDVIGSLAALIGIWVAGKKHPSFPYGLYKAETLATLISAIAILLAGYEIARRALLGPVIHPDVGVALPVTVFCLAISLSFGLLQVKAGKKLGSPALVADGKDYLADSLSTGIVILGLSANYFGLNVDRWAAALVAVFVFRAGGALLFEAIRELLDASIDRETERKIISLVESDPAVIRVKKTMSRTAGGRFIVDMDIVLKTKSDVAADKVADRLENEIVNKFPRVVMARIRPHFEQSGEFIRITPLEGPDGSVATHFAKAPWFMIEQLDSDTWALRERQLIENPYRDVERKRGFLVGKWLLSFKPDQLILARAHGGTAEALLREAGVQILTNEDETDSPSVLKQESEAPVDSLKTMNRN